MKAIEVPTWTFKEHGARAHKLLIHFRHVNDALPTLHISDVHWDSIYCRRDLLKRHLDQAKALNAPVFIYGDWFDFMQGKFDKRARFHEMHPEILRYAEERSPKDPKYVDAVIELAAEWLKPYAKQIVLISEGNHETAMSERAQTNVLTRLAERLRMYGSRCCSAPYWGFVVMTAYRSRHSDTRIVCYHHGYGGGGEVTRGLIDNNRTRGQYFAHFYISGHIHRKNIDTNKITQINPNHMTIETVTQRFLRIAGYKEEQEGQWHSSKGRARRPLGGWWLTPTLIGANRLNSQFSWVPSETDGDD